MRVQSRADWFNEVRYRLCDPTSRHARGQTTLSDAYPDRHLSLQRCIDEHSRCVCHVQQASVLRPTASAFRKARRLKGAMLPQGCNACG